MNREIELTMYGNYIEDMLIAWLKDYVEGIEFDFGMVGERIRCYFTTICILDDIRENDTKIDKILLPLHHIIYQENKGLSYELFKGFMIKYI